MRWMTELFGWFWTVVALLVLTMLLALPGLLVGCSAEYWTGRIKPITVIKVNPVRRTIEVTNTKDVDIAVEDMKYGEEGGHRTFTLGKLTLSDKSTPVIDADAARMPYVIEAQRLQVELHRQFGMNLALGLAGGADLVSRIIPGGIPAMSCGPAPDNATTSGVQP